MRKIVFIFLGTLLSYSCSNIDNQSSAITENDLMKLNLKGDVKSFRVMKFLAIGNFRVVSRGERVKQLYNKEVLFNLDGNKIEENEYIPDGTLANRTVYLYKKDKLIEYNNYDSQGILFGTGKFDVDENNRTIKLDYKATDGTYSWSESYDYDSNGNLTEVNRFKTEEVIDSKELYTLDDKGRVGKSELYKESKLVAKNEYSYDDDGYFTELKFGESQYTYKYDYDYKGNWIKKIVFEDNNPSGILVREIEYFN